MRSVAEVQDYLDRNYFKNSVELEKGKALLRKRYPGQAYHCRCLLARQPEQYILVRDLKHFISLNNQ